MKAFDNFAKRCAAAGLKAEDCGQGHWRILGGLVPVNWYPLSKGRTIWIQGTTGRTSFSGTEQQAIAAAKGDAPTLKPGLVPTKRPGQNWARKIRKKWMKAGPRCYWCRTKLDWATLTIDHRIPLYRGGSNQEDNLVPACQPCNQRRGHELGAPQ